MTEEIINCDFYNDKICNLFTEYFKFKVECKNLTLCTIEDDAERECPYKQLKRLEFELKVTKADYEASEQENKQLKERCSIYLDLIEDISSICGDEVLDKINEVLNEKEL